MIFLIRWQSIRNKEATEGIERREGTIALAEEEEEATKTTIIGISTEEIETITQIEITKNPKETTRKKIVEGEAEKTMMIANTVDLNINKLIR